MKNMFLCIISILSLYPFASAQIIDQIKSASDDHSARSNSNSSSDNNDIVIDHYTSTTDDYYYDYSEQFLSGSAPVYRRESRRNDSTYKYAALNLLYRRTSNSGQVAISVPEIQIKLGGYFGSIRSNKLIEEGVKKVDYYETVDVQFLGFQSNPNSLLALNGSFGFMAEQHSANLYTEAVGGVRLQSGPRFGISWEGRVAWDKGIRVRNEGTLALSATLIHNRDFRVTSDFFVTSSTYYEEVSIQAFGFGLGLRF